MKTKRANSRRGLLAGGNWVIDQVKIIDVHPQPERLANILSQANAPGGARCNLLLALAKSGAPFPLYGAGFVGKDTSGEQSLKSAANIKLIPITSPPRHKRPHLSPT
jgi:sugar/nucleoside kinase (ribokinase family)